MRGNRVKLNADLYDTSECPSALDLFVETLLLDRNCVSTVFAAVNALLQHYSLLRCSKTTTVILSQALYTATTLTEYDRWGLLTLASLCCICRYVLVPGWPRAQDQVLSLGRRTDSVRGNGVLQKLCCPRQEEKASCQWVSRPVIPERAVTQQQRLASEIDKFDFRKPVRL